jgi:DNA-binding transcriptional LysR family regulator
MPEKQQFRTSGSPTRGLGQPTALPRQPVVGRQSTPQPVVPSAADQLPDLQDVAVFAAVVECGGFSAAAARLGVPKSTVSRKVAELEEALSVRLLHRTTRRIALTEAGAAFHEQATRALTGLQQAIVQARDQQTEPRGVLRITAPPDFGRFWLAELIQAYLARYPEVRVEVELTGRVVDLVQEGFDVALRAGALPDSSLVVRKLSTMQVWLFAGTKWAKEHAVPQVPADLEGQQFVLFRSRDGQTRMHLQGPDGAQADVQIRGRLSVDDFTLARHACLAGQGLAYLPALHGMADLREGTLVRVLPDWHAGGGTLSLVYPTARHVPAKVRRFVEHTVAWFSPPPWERICASHGDCPKTNDL